MKKNENLNKNNKKTIIAMILYCRIYSYYMIPCLKQSILSYVPILIYNSIKRHSTKYVTANFIFIVSVNYINVLVKTKK